MRKGGGVAARSAPRSGDLVIGKPGISPLINADDTDWIGIAWDPLGSHLVTHLES
jgi:hypothetical protein